MSRLTSVTFTSPVFPHDRLSEFIPTLVRGYRGQGVGVGEPFPILGPFLQNNVSRSLVWSHSGILRVPCGQPWPPLDLFLLPDIRLLSGCWVKQRHVLKSLAVWPASHVVGLLAKTGYRTKVYFCFSTSIDHSEPGVRHGLCLVFTDLQRESKLKGKVED